MDRLVIGIILGFLLGIAVMLVYLGITGVDTSSINNTSTTPIKCIWKDAVVRGSLNAIQVKLYGSGECYVIRIDVEYYYLNADSKIIKKTLSIDIGKQYSGNEFIVSAVKEIDIQGILYGHKPWKITIYYIENNTPKTYTIETLPG